MIKNNFISMQKGFLALMSAALLFSCSSIEPFEMEGNDVLLASSSDPCITEDPNTWVRRDYLGAYNNNTGVKVVAYNSPTHIIYEFSSGETFESVKIGTTTLNLINNTWSEVLPAGWNSTAVVSKTFTFMRRNDQGIGGGNSTSVATSYTLIPVCPPPTGCVNNLSIIDNGDGNYTFTYDSPQAISNAHVVFTFAQGVVVSGLTGFSPSGSTMQSHMDLVAGKNTFNVTLDTDCRGTGQPNANLWTDFKVNDESKKCGLKNIVKSCN